MTIDADRYPKRELSEYEREYLFDLHGCLILRDAVDPYQLARLNAWVDDQPQDLPVGSWLRDYPSWYMRHGSRLVWCGPWLVGHLVHALIWIVVIACIITALALMITGLWELAAMALGAGGEETATD